jgi:hypothetical protein
MVVAWILLLCLAVSRPIRAQVSGATLTGAITDAQGGAVAGAKISVKNLGTGIVSETTTNDVGAYNVPNLIPADYEVSVSAGGFSTTTSKVTLTVGAKQEMNIKLTVGQVTQTVEVTGAAVQIDLASSTISGDVNGSQVRELPLNGRDWAALATLQPGVMLSREHQDVTAAGGAGGRGLGDQLSISGGRPSQNSYRLDGVIVNDYSNQGPGSVLGANLGVDAIAEFSVLTSSYSAEYGFTSGGVINAVTKSGTNTFHGDLFEFVRNDKFDANDFFNNVGGLAKGPLRQNQFGGSGGWRIFKDKTFLFGAYEGVRRVKDIPHFGDVTVSDAVRGGSYATCGPTGAGCPTGTVANASCTVLGVPGGCTPTVTVTIDPAIRKLLPVYPAANGGLVPGTANAANNISEWGLNASENFFTLRADQRLSSKDSIFATYLRDSSDFTQPQLLSAVNIGVTSYRQAAILEWTHVFGPSVVNTVRVGDSRTTNLGGDCPSSLVPAAGDPANGMLTGFFAPGINLNTSATKITSFSGGLHWCTPEELIYGQLLQLFDDAGYTRGNHSFKFGFDYLPQEENGYFPLGGSAGGGTWSNFGTYPVVGGSAGSSGRVATAAEAGCLKTGKSPGSLNGNDYDPSCGTLVNFLTNQPLSATRPNDLPAIGKHYLRSKIFSGYVQDDWRIRRSLTLNLGLRYEMSTIPTEIKGQALLVPTPTTILPCLPAPTPADESCSATSPNSALRPSFWTHNPTLKNFEPRIGFAWDPFHDGKTAIRAGFGIFDSLPLPYELLLDNVQAPPFRSTFAALGFTSALSVQPSPAQGDYPSKIVADAATHVINPATRSNWMYVDSNIKRNYVYQFNMNIQRQFTPNTTLTVGYAGARAFHNPLKSEGGNTILPAKAPDSAGGFYYWPGGATGVGTFNTTGIFGTTTGVSLSSAQIQGLMLNPSIGALIGTYYEAKSWYDSLQIRLDRKLTHGFQAQASFTYSKTLDNSSGSVAGDNSSFDFTSTPWYDLTLNKGLSDFNVGRNLTINTSWTSPTVKSLGAFGSRALGGWQLGGIISLASGIPIYPNMPDILGENRQTVNSGTIVAGCSPQNLVNPNYRHDLDYLKQSCFQFAPTATALNSAFCDSPPGSAFGTKTRPGLDASVTNVCPNIRGNLGRNTITGPGIVNFDFSAFKNNYIPKISENFNLQFRAEFFNAFNRSNFAPAGNNNPYLSTGLPNTAPPGGQSGFGAITRLQGTNRQIQLALKAVW